MPPICKNTPLLSSLVGVHSLAALLLACMFQARAQAPSTPSNMVAYANASASPSFPRRLPTSDELFDWAESSFPAHFPSHSLTQAAAQFAFRYYQPTSNYLGIANNEVFVLGTATGGNLVKAGNLADFSCVTVLDNCYWWARKITGLSNVDSKPDIPPLRIADIYWFKSTKRRADLNESSWPPYAYGDFKGDGRLGIFMASTVYQPSSPIAQARPGQFEFFSQDAEGNFYSDSSLYSGAEGCIHPRKAITADFNGDGKPDIFLACHGYDAQPFPGEDSYIFLSSPSGKYTAKVFPQGAGFTHGVSSGDVDKNGTIDLVLADPRFGSRLFLNDGRGNFTPKPLPMPHSDNEWGYDVVEIVDIDGDGNLDIWVARPETASNFTFFLMGDGTSDYSMRRTWMLPKMPAAPIPLDFVHVDLNKDGKKDLIVARTMTVPFYKGIGIQVLQNTGSGFIATGEWTGASTTSWVPFVPWIRYRNGMVVADDEVNGLSIPLPVSLMAR